MKKVPLLNVGRSWVVLLDVGRSWVVLLVGDLWRLRSCSCSSFSFRYAFAFSIFPQRCASPLPSTTAEDKKRQYKDEDQNSAGGASGDDSD
ncbi:hypothetical protein Bca101_024635 [Brassica carinata]